MRRFELILFLIEVLAVGWPVVFGVRTRQGIVAGLLVAGYVAHWQVEGLRWQMVPLYGVALGLTIGDLVLFERTLLWTRRFARGVFGTGGLMIAALLPLLMPVPTLPVPSGPAGVGTMSLLISDADRVESYGPTPGGPRRFNVQVWYPADVPPDAVSGPWTDDWDVVAPATARRMGFPSWFFSHTGYTSAHSVTAAPVAAGRYPVVIYSHGWTGFRTIAVNQMEMLASNGYVVIAIDHTYGAVATRFPDGDIAEYDSKALPHEEDVGPVAYQIASEQLIATFAGDIVEVLDGLDEGEGGAFAFVARSADLARVGVYGHSAGGGAAVWACLEDERCDAVLGMDAWVEPLPDRTLAIDLARPAMFMRSDEWRGTENDALLKGIAGRSAHTVHWIGIEGAGHNDFVITPLISPVANVLGLKGPIPAGRILPIIDRYLLGFFDVYLLQTGSAAIDTTSFPEVSLEVLRPRG